MQGEQVYTYYLTLTLLQNYAIQGKNAQCKRISNGSHGNKAAIIPNQIWMSLGYKVLVIFHLVTSEEKIVDQSE